jgi:uncharacterized protein YbcI
MLDSSQLPAGFSLPLSARRVVLSTEGSKEEKSPVTDSRRTRLPASLSAGISRAFGSLWSEYGDKRPSEIRTEIRGNVITCQLIDAVGVFNGSMSAPQTHDSVRGVGKLTPAGYKRDAVAAVVRLTRQRVTSFVSSHDQATDVATEVFTLEPSLQKGRPRSLAGGSSQKV